jgi:hypothetical protein
LLRAIAQKYNWKGRAKPSALVPQAQPPAAEKTPEVAVEPLPPKKKWWKLF